MSKWYGQEMLDEMTQNGWVVDHMNNEHYDCRISNLEFLPTRDNVSKGQTVDFDSEEMRYNLALTLCKDFATGYYQIHLGCNDPISLLNETTGKLHHLSALKLLYDCDYRIVVNDARVILLNYSLYHKVQLNKLNYIDIKPVFAKMIVPTQDEVGKPFVQRDGQWYACIGNGIWLHSSSVEEGWIPTQD